MSVFLGLAYHHLYNDLSKRYSEAVELLLVDQSQWAATLLSSGVKLKTLSHSLAQLKERNPNARIYEHYKDTAEVSIYVTDAKGIVLFHSDSPNALGKDFSKWRDVKLTLNGKYGARATPTSDKENAHSLFWVAAPILQNDKITGVVSVGKSTKDFKQYVEKARYQIGAWLSGLTLLLMALGFVLSKWVTHPLTKWQSKLKAFRTEDEMQIAAPTQEFQVVSETLTSLKSDLAAKKYIENYIQSLTHELKSPIAGIMGASEILEYAKNREDQQKFLSNIQIETKRLKQIVDQILELAALERQEDLKKSESISTKLFLNELRESVGQFCLQKQVTINWPSLEGTISGDRFLLQQAFHNLLINALEYSPLGSQIEFTLDKLEGGLGGHLIDTGPGIPPYALDRIFERFYSLPKPDSQKKGTGLGLPFVKEVFRLHSGKISVSNHPDKGAMVRFFLPMNPMK